MTEEQNEKPLDSGRRGVYKTRRNCCRHPFMIVPRFVLGGKGYTAPSDKLLIAGVGAGGKGESDIANLLQERLKRK